MEETEVKKVDHHQDDSKNASMGWNAMKVGFISHDAIIETGATVEPAAFIFPKAVIKSEEMSQKYFLIFGDHSGRVLDASRTNGGEVVLWGKHGGDNQLWFWDNQNQGVLRNKQVPDKVLEFHCVDYQEDNWGKVYLNEFNHGWNQKWQLDGKEIICKGFQNRTIENLRLEVHSSATHNGAKVGVYHRTGNPNQQWRLQGKLEFHMI